MVLAQNWAGQLRGAGLLLPHFSQEWSHPSYLNCKGAQDDSAEDGVAEDAVEDVALAVDLAGIDLVEELHHDEGVEDDGVVL